MASHPEHNSNRYSFTMQELWFISWKFLQDPRSFPGSPPHLLAVVFPNSRACFFLNKAVCFHIVWSQQLPFPPPDGVEVGRVFCRRMATCAKTRVPGGDRIWVPVRIHMRSQHAWHSKSPSCDLFLGAPPNEFFIAVGVCLYPNRSPYFQARRSFTRVSVTEFTWLKDDDATCRLGCQRTLGVGGGFAKLFIITLFDAKPWSQTAKNWGLSWFALWCASPVRTKCRSSSFLWNIV